MAPNEADILMIASEYGIAPDWEFMDLHPKLIEQLDVCRPHQEPKAEPVNVPSPGELSVEVQETQV
eukprot:7890497-Prorocentrum_lima.AAC.1